MEGRKEKSLFEINQKKTKFSTNYKPNSGNGVGIGIETATPILNIFICKFRI